MRTMETDQTFLLMHRLICVFIGCTSQKVRFLTLRLKLIMVQDRRALLMCLGYNAGSFVAQREC